MSLNELLGKRKREEELDILPRKIISNNINRRRKFISNAHYLEKNDCPLDPLDPLTPIWHMINEFPPEIRIHIIEWISIPDLEFEPVPLKKMEHSRSQFVFSTKNNVIYQYSQLMRYLYGYFRSDETRHIYLIFPSLRFSCAQEISEIPKLGIILPKYPNLTKLYLARILLKKIDIPFLPHTLSSITIVTQKSISWNTIDFLLDHLPSLYYLYLHMKNVSFPRESIPVIKKMCRLTHVGLINCDVTNEISKILLDTTKKYPNKIRELMLTGNKITAEGLSPIVSNNCIRTLRVSKNAISDKGTEYLKQCKTLEEISVDQCDLSGASLGHLFEIQTLKRIWCRQNNFVDGFQNVANHCNLSILNLHDNKKEFSVDMMLALSKCESLHTLVMNKCHLGDEHIRALLEGNKTLRRLYINWNDKLSMEAIKIIAKNKSLYKLAYSQHRLNDEMLIYLLRNNTTIEVLNVPYVKEITNSFLKALESNKSLKTLKIRETNVTEEGLQFIMDRCTSISQLSYGRDKEKRWIRPGSDLLRLVD